MAQHDYDLANGTGAAFRADANAALAAILTNNSGASEPSTRQAYMWWADTNAGLLKLRNAANNAWITVGSLSTANLGLVPVAGGTQDNALGTAALPSYGFDGDANTGMYSPGADIVGFSTVGTERGRFTAQGYLKASNSGSYAFSTSPIHEIVSNNATNPTLYVYNSSATYTGTLLEIAADRNTSNGTYGAISVINRTASTVPFRVNDGGLILSVGSYNSTTANAANLTIAADGTIQRSTSSLIYKTDVQPIADEAADVLLSLRPVRYRSLAEGDRSEWSYYGLIAEEVAELDPRLVHWGYRDEDYEIVSTEEQRYNEETEEVEVVEVNRRQLRESATLKPEGVQYDRLGVLLLSLVQRQEARIAELEVRLAAHGIGGDS